MKWLIKGGRVIDPLQKLDAQVDVLVADGKVAQVGISLEDSSASQLNAGGLVVLPGLVDMHVHLREPGYEHKESIASGTAAAARGGFTAVACMPNTNPVIDNAALVSYVMEKAGRVAAVPVYPIGAISRGSKGEELAEMGDMAQAGAVAFSDDGQPVQNNELMRRALEYAANCDRVIISHCEDKSLVGGGSMHEGYWSTVLGLRGIPAVAEEIMVARDILLAEYTGTRIHLAHISTAGSVELVRWAKERGVAVTAEATPHHFSLTDAAVKDYDTSTKVNPPLRTAEDVEAICRGLADGTIDAVATDHAPHDRVEKEVEYEAAPFGLVGLETAVPLAVNMLINKERTSWARLAAIMSQNPARILGLPQRTIKENSPACITLIDPNKVQKVNARNFASLGKNSPFDRWELKGWPVGTMVDGEWVFRSPEWTD